MKVYYISPSTVPSRAANSMHVMYMCEALTQLGHDVSLFVNARSSTVCKKTVRQFYGIDTKNLDIVTIECNALRGVELMISLRALVQFIKDAMNLKRPDMIISRNLYAAVLLGVFLKSKVVYETHAPERGLRRTMQSWLVRSGRIPCVVISEALRKIIISLHDPSNKASIHVMHDAGRPDQRPMEDTERKYYRKKYLGPYLNTSAYERIVGYFGHLYPGRGIEIIRGIAAKLPRVAFIVYGGNEKEIEEYHGNNGYKNLYFMGYLPPAQVPAAMAMMDMLLMPYQRSVSVGLADVDTAQWMSPMKLFEYMSVGVPIIASDLPVLREVLQDRTNCLLVTPDDVNSWVEAINQLMTAPELGAKIKDTAYQQLQSEHTWYKRAKAMTSLLVAS